MVDFLFPSPLLSSFFLAFFFYFLAKESPFFFFYSKLVKTLCSSTIFANSLVRNEPNKKTQMKNLTLLGLLGLTLLAGCKKAENKEVINAVDTLTTKAFETPSSEDSLVVGHTTENSLDWMGTYEGTLPCASCPGIETKLIINQDYTYSLEENYLGQEAGENNDFKQEGVIEFSKDGSYITLKPNSTETSPNPSIYFVAEGYIHQVTQVLDRDFREGYRLEKK